MEQTVYLTEIYTNQIALPDVTAEEAAAGDVSTFTRTLKNLSNVGLSQAIAWMDEATAVYIEISANGSDWSAPTSRGAAISLGTVGAGETITLHIRRTIPANCPANPLVRTRITVRWSGV